MLYARHLFHIAMFANEQERVSHPIGKNTMRAYAEHACSLLNCEPVYIEASYGALQILIDIGIEHSVVSIVSSLKDWLSAWITQDPGSDYWSPYTYVCAVSPEEKQATICTFSASSPQYVEELKRNSCGDTTMHCMHIIYITSRERLLLPLKFNSLLKEALKKISEEMGAVVIDIGAMRNHMHLLCRIPSGKSPKEWIEHAKNHLYEWMKGNRHFCKIGPWAYDSISYTVSPHKIIQEEYAVAHQNSVHTRIERQNEMSQLYQRLQIPWVASLH